MILNYFSMIFFLSFCLYNYNHLSFCCLRKIQKKFNSVQKSCFLCYLTTLSGHVTFTWGMFKAQANSITLCWFCICNFSCSLRFKERIYCICSVCFIHSNTYYDQLVLSFLLGLLGSYCI